MWRVQCRLPSPVAEALRGTLAGCPQRFSSARETLPRDLASRPPASKLTPTPPLRQPRRQHIDRARRHRRRMQHRVDHARQQGACLSSPRAFPSIAAAQIRARVWKRPPAPPLTPPPSPDAAGARMVPSHHPRPHRRRRPPTRAPSTTSPPAWRATDPLPSCTSPPPTARRSGSSPPASTPGKIAVARVDEAGVRHEMGEAVLPEDTDDEGARSSPLVTAVVAAPTSRGARSPSRGARAANSSSSSVPAEAE